MFSDCNEEIKLQQHTQQNQIVLSHYVGYETQQKISSDTGD